MSVSCSQIPEYSSKETSTVISSDTSSDMVIPSGTLTINNNYYYTQTDNASLSIDVDNSTEMCFSIDGSYYTAWEPYSSTKSITIPSGHGVKTVYGKFRNNDGESIISDTIIPLDEGKITASDGTANAYFGGGNWGHTSANVVLSYDGNTILTSSPLNNKVYVYKKNNNLWTEVEILNCPDAGSNLFGQSIACTPDTEYIVIGALNKASIYIYKWSGTTYTLKQTIISQTPMITNDYAVTASISDNGNRILVGSWNYNSGIGRAYLYEKTGLDWISYSEFLFENSGGIAADHFGLGVKLSGDGNTIAISAPGNNVTEGSLFIYKWDGSSWSGFEYSSSDGIAGDMLGRHIGMSYDGNKIVAGTRCWNQGNVNQGATYLFEWNGSAYSETHKFTASDGVANDKFGYSVAMSSDGNSVAIGSPFPQGSAVKGKAYVFRYRNSAWIEEAILNGSDSAAGEFYGNITAISGDGSVIAVSASMDNIGANSSQGSVYLYY